MKNSNSSLCAGLQLAGLLFACFRLQAKDFHVAPDGTPAGPGSSSQPYDLATALSGQVAHSDVLNVNIHGQTRHGIVSCPVFTQVLVFWCIVYNNGWGLPDNAEGHGLYVQGEGGTRTLAQNIVFNNSGGNMHVYENT